MSGFGFAHPEWVTLFTAVVGVVMAVLGVGYLERRARTRRLLGHARARIAGDLALVAALVGIAIALAGPRLGTRTVVVSTSGIDVALLFDVSRSMDAADVAPDRITRARAAAAETLARLSGGDRVALAAFAGRGVLLTPLTPDKEALAELLPALDSGLVHPGGSDLPAGALATLDAFDAASARPRVLLLFTDGESSAQDASVALAALQRSDVRVVAALLGTEAGGTIPDHGSELRDDQGEVVLTRRHSTRVRELADATRGTVFESDTWGGFDIDALVGSLRKDAGSAPGELIEREIVAASVLPFAIGSLVLLSVEALLAGRPRPRRRRTSPTPAGPAGAALRASVGAVTALFLLLPSTLRGEPTDSGPEPYRADARALLRSGLAAAEEERWEAARYAFGAAAVLSRDTHLAALAYHDLGVAALTLGDYAAARDAFFDSLALSPGRDATQYNLEWALLAIERDEQTPERPLLDDPAPTDPPKQKAPPPQETMGDEGAGEAGGELEREAEPSESEAAGSETQGTRPDEPRAQPPSRPPLDARQRARWLDRIEDDPAASLRSAAVSQPGEEKGSFGARARW